MNGAESLVRSLIAAGIDTCFANPGTSEMHFVAALDRVPGIRCVLGLFEGVATGAADGYARMADKPACTLLHLGPGLANGLANLHNARRAAAPVVNIVGEHATYHKKHDAPLTSDIEGVARPMSHWVRTSKDSSEVGSDAAEAVEAARTPPGRIATLILPADAAWTRGGQVAEPRTPPERMVVPGDVVEQSAMLLRSAARPALLLGGPALREEALLLAGRIAAATGARLLCPTSNARWQRGAGRVMAQRVPYPVDEALDTLKDLDVLVLAGAKAPVAFFAYPDKPSRLTPEDSQIQTLARPEEDILGALEALVVALGAGADETPAAVLRRPDPPTGALNGAAIAQAVTALLPEHAIVVDEGISVGREIAAAACHAPPHDWLQITGGAIGIGLPLATGAAIACRERRVLSLQADGSAMYTVQALWTQARESLPITTLIFANRAYESLRHELYNVGAGNPGKTALDMLELDRPVLDWVSLAKGLGVEASRATTAEELYHALAAGLASDGPSLIEVIL